MIKVSYDVLGKTNTQQGIMKLAESEFRDMEGFRAKQIAMAARKAFFAMRDEYKAEIQDKYALKDEKGNAKPAAEGKALELKLPFQCKDEDAEKAKELLDGFGKKTVEFKYKKLSLAGLFRANAWTPNELEGLEPFYDEPSESEQAASASANVIPFRQ